MLIIILSTRDSSSPPFLKEAKGGLFNNISMREFRFSGNLHYPLFMEEGEINIAGSS
jgi:hypothetical protein